MQEPGMVPAKKAHTNIETGETAKEERKQQKESEGNRMKMMKKISALVLALVMVLTVSTVAFSAGDTGRTVGGTNYSYQGSGDDRSLTSSSDSIPLVKSIVFINADGSNVFEPDITFSYTVAPAEITSGEVSVTDANDVTTNVLPGVAGGVIGTTITFGKTIGGENTTAVEATATGKNVERTGSLSFDINQFSRAGIYRYVITETPSPSDITSVGLTARSSNYSNKRYLDVYIKNGDNGLEMFGAVMFAATEASEDITKTTKKTTGFTPSDVPLNEDDTVDRYTTYSFIIKKNVQGDLADRSHEFPFYISVANSISGAKFTYTADGTETFTGTTKNGTAVTLSADDFTIGADSTDSSLKLKHNDTIKLEGVPSKQGSDKLTVVVKEYNNTDDTYTPSASATKGTPEMAAGSGTSAAIKPFDIVSNDTDDQIITMNNTLTAISPTGYVTRFAPYALILIGGIVMLLIAKKHKKHTDEE